MVTKAEVESVFNVAVACFLDFGKEAILKRLKEKGIGEQELNEVMAIAKEAIKEIVEEKEE